jgi:flavin-binding protein dodecin
MAKGRRRVDPPRLPDFPGCNGIRSDAEAQSHRPGGFAGAKWTVQKAVARGNAAHVDFGLRTYLLSFGPFPRSEEHVMAESVYKIIEIVGTSPTSWEKAAAAAVERAASSLRDLRIAEVVQQDIAITDGKVEAYRVRLKVSFKYEE